MAGKPRLDPETHAAFQIVALANRISASASQAYLRCFGVGVMQWRILALTALRPGITAREISVASSVDKSPVSRAVRSLIALGHLKSAEDAGDNRRSPLFLTPSGEALHDRIILASLARERQLLNGLSAEERRTLFDLLGRMAANAAEALGDDLDDPVQDR